MRVAIPCAFLSLLVLAWLGHVAATDVKPLRLSLSPHLAFEPADVRVQIRLVPDESDRVLEIRADSDNGMSRASSWTLDGAESPTLWIVRWPAMSAGDYAVVAAVGNRHHIRASVRDTFRLLSRAE